MKKDLNVIAFSSGMMSMLEKTAQDYAEAPDIDNHLADTSVVSTPGVPAIEAPKVPEKEQPQEYHDVELSPDEFYQLMHMLQAYR